MITVGRASTIRPTPACLSATRRTASLPRQKTLATGPNSLCVWAIALAAEIVAWRSPDIRSAGNGIGQERVESTNSACVRPDICGRGPPNVRKPTRSRLTNADARVSHGGSKNF